MKKRRVAFKLSFDLPTNATLADAKAYVHDAVGTMKGCYRPPGVNGEEDPGDPMWELDPDTIRISRIIK